jgi:hypothetical protein
MRIEVTHHAVERYRSRYAPELSWAEADAALRTLVVTARSTKALSLMGDPIWTSDGGVRLAVKYDKRMRAQIVVTVLPPEGADVTAEDLAPPADLSIANPPRRGHLVEWELAQAERELRKRAQDLAQAKDRRDRADTAFTDAQTKWMEARKRFEDLKEKNHG